jgi:hypothetical protein
MDHETREKVSSNEIKDGPALSISSHGESKQETEKLGRDSITDAEQQILDGQLDTPPVKGAYRMLFRFATTADFLIIAISSISAVAAGVVLPLMTVNSLQATRERHLTCP